MRAFLPRVTTLVIATGALGATTVGSAVPASAADGLQAAIERPVMYFALTDTATAQTICGVGELRVPPTREPVWTTSAVGVRSDATTFTASDTAATENATVCVAISKHGAAYGSYSATFTYDSADDLPSQIVALALWSPSGPEIVATFQ